MLSWLLTGHPYEGLLTPRDINLPGRPRTRCCPDLIISLVPRLCRDLRALRFSGKTGPGPVGFLHVTGRAEPFFQTPRRV